MNTEEAKIFAAEIDHNLPVIDLHGLFPDEAKNQLDNFLYQCFQKRISAARVVYGIGTGKLQGQILPFLANHGLVEISKDEGGSAIVILDI